MLALAVAAVVAVPMALFDANGLMDKAYEQLLTVYPDELEVTVEQGRYSINQDLPYAIPLPTAWQSNDGMVNGIIFTSDILIGSIADVMALDSYLVLTETTAYSVQPNGEVSARDIVAMLEEYDEDEPLVFSEELINQIPMQKIKGLWWLSKWFYVPMAAFGGFVASFFVLTFWLLIKVLLYGFIAFISYELLLNNKLSYGRILQLTIHVLIGIALLRWLLTPFPLGLGGFVWFLVYMLGMFIIGRHLEKVGALRPEETPKKLQNTSVKAVQASKRSATTVAPVAKKTASKKSTVTKKSSITKKTVAKKATPKKVVAKVPTAKTEPVKKASAAKKVATKKTTVKKAPTKKVATKKTASKKVDSKKATPKKTATKKTVAKKAVKKAPAKKVAKKKTSK